MAIGDIALRFIKSSRYAGEAELYRDTSVPMGQRRMLSATLMVFDEARKQHGGPLIINSGRRSQERQAMLVEHSKRAAKYSPHVKGVALDVDVPDEKNDLYLVNLIISAAVELELPRPRMGFLAYREGKESSTFVHYDYAFLLPVDDSTPAAWRKSGLIW